MAICERCPHFRRPNPPSDIFARLFSIRDPEVTGEIRKIAEGEYKLKEEEDSFKKSAELRGQDKWPARPVTSAFCGLRERDDVFLIAEVKNRGRACNDDVGTSERRPCNECAHCIAATGRKTDQTIEEAFAQLALSARIGGASASAVEARLSEHQRNVGAKMALEIRTAAVRRTLSTEPAYLDYCSALSTVHQEVGMLEGAVPEGAQFLVARGDFMIAKRLCPLCARRADAARRARSRRGPKSRYGRIPII
jgi:hypothetical protein